MVCNGGGGMAYPLSRSKGIHRVAASLEKVSEKVVDEPVKVSAEPVKEAVKLGKFVAEPCKVDAASSQGNHRQD